MEVVITSSTDDIAELAADAVQRLLESTREPALGLPTGRSPLSTYRELVERYRDGRVTFSRTRAFLLDEYVGLPARHPASSPSFIRREFTDHVDLPDSALFAPDGRHDDPARASSEFEDRIASGGGIDLQLLGIGRNGHIAFNEPSSSLGSRTRFTTLTQATRTDNARFFGGDVDTVPRHVVTQGVGTILEARHLVLLAHGAGKADAVARAVEGPVTAMVPASALQLHPHATVLLDEAAAGALRHADYYREAFAGKPDWQHL